METTETTVQNVELSALIDILQIIGVIVITIALAGLAYKMIVYKDNADKRTLLMQNSSKILIGAFIIGGMLTLSGFLNGFIDKLSSDLPTKEIPKIEFAINEADKKIKDKGKWYEDILAGMVRWIPDYVLGKPNEKEKEDEKGLRERLFGFKTLDELLTPKQNEHIFSKTAPEGGGVSEWEAIMIGYNVTRAASIVLLIIMVFKTGISMVMSSTNEKKLEEVKEDIYRWVFVCIIIAMGPLLIDGILSFFTWITGLITVPGLNTSMLNNVKTGNVVATECVRLFYTYLTVKLNVMFMVSKWCLVIMIIFTPIAATLWGINKRFHAFEIWLGEIISNGALRLSYTLVFLGLNLIFMVGNHSVIVYLIGLSLVIKLGDVLRNSLNGIMARIGGMDESGHASSMFSGAKSGVRGTLNGVRRLADATGGASDLAKGLFGKGDNAEQFAKMGNSHNIAKAVNGEGAAAKAGAVADMMSSDGDMQDIGSSGTNKSSAQASVQDLFMSNLASENYRGSRKDGFVTGMINNSQNKEAVNSAKEKTIGQMADVYQDRDNLDRKDAMQKAKTEFNKNMYGSQSVDKNGNLSSEGKAIDKDFTKRVAKGQYHVAKKHLAGNNMESNVRNMLKDTI